MAKKARKAGRQSFLITNGHARSRVAEAYRTLRTNMGFTEMDHPCRTVMITSSHMVEGKSTTASNLAIVMAQAGNHVLLVDCDLRKPLQHRLFNISNQVGFTSCLRQRALLDESFHPGPVEHLTILPSGPLPPNPSELLASEQCKRIWADLKARYDYVFIDTPPVLLVADAAILAAQVDGVLLVVDSGRTRIDHAQQSKEQLTKANAHIIGVVLNKVKTEDDKQYYYYSEDVSSN